MNIGSSDECVSSALEKLSMHLDMLAGQIFSVEEELSLYLGKDTIGSSVSISKFQSLDFSRQSLEDCSLLALLLSEIPSLKAAGYSEMDIANKLKLSSTKRLVTSSASHCICSPSGDIDLF